MKENEMLLVETMIEGYNQRIAHRQKRGGLKSMAYFYEIQKKFYENILHARRDGKNIAWCGLFVPLELMHAMDIVPFIPESFATAAGAGVERYMDLGEGYGIPNYACSPHRVAMGMAREGVVPSPDFMISTAQTCDSTVKIFDLLSNHYKCPTFFMDRPYSHDTEEAIAYYADEIRSLIAFLEDQTGRKLNYERLQETIQLSKVAYDYWHQIGQFRKNIPSPLAARDAFRDRGVMLTAVGLPESVTYFEDRYREILELVENKQGGIAEEKCRIIWLYAPPFHDLKIMDWMAEEHGAAIVMDTFNALAESEGTDTDDPVEYLARASYRGYLARTSYGDMAAGGTVRDVVRMCKDYQADGVIFFAHFACKQYCGMLRLYADGIREEAGIPTLTLDGDLLDPRVVSGAQMRNRLNEFFQVLATQC